MRKIRLSGNDYDLFGEDISGPQFDFFQKHRDTFKRMWTDQGKKFWSRFVEAFKIYTTKHGMLKDFPGKTDQYEEYIGEAFELLHTTFVEGKANAAKNIVIDIVSVAQKRHMLQYLESKSYAKDPFYNRETRDVFRRLFGPKDKKSSYMKTYLLIPVYLKFGGSVARILRRWMSASDQDSSDETYWDAKSKGNSTKDKDTDSKADAISEARRKAEMEATRKARLRRMKKMELELHMAAMPMTLPENIERVRNAAVRGTSLQLVDIEELKKDTSSIASQMQLQLYLNEKFNGDPRGPVFLPSYGFGDPRFNDPLNPLFDVFANPTEPWYQDVDLWKYRQFLCYMKALGKQPLHWLGIPDIHELYLHISDSRSLHIIEQIYKDYGELKNSAINKKLEDYPVNFIGSYNYCNLCFLTNGSMRMIGYRPNRHLKELKPMEDFIAEKLYDCLVHINYYDLPQLIETLETKGEKEAWKEYQKVDRDPKRTPLSKKECSMKTQAVEGKSKYTEQSDKSMDVNVSENIKSKESSLEDGNQNRKPKTLEENQKLMQANVSEDVKSTEASVSEDVKSTEANVSEDVKSTE
ncbi:unnamed protein product, partial [Owenia fusiformis]